MNQIKSNSTLTGNSHDYTLSRLTLRKMRRMVESDTDGYGSTFVCMSFLILTLCVLCLRSAYYYCRVCSGNDGTRTLKLAHSREDLEEQYRFVSCAFLCDPCLLNVRIMTLPLPLSVHSTKSIPPYFARGTWTRICLSLVHLCEKRLQMRFDDIVRP